MISKEQVEKFSELQLEKHELGIEAKRIRHFLARKPDNKDNKRAINKDQIFTKFAGTACYLPVAIFTVALTKRKTTITSRLKKLETELENI